MFCSHWRLSNKGPLAAIWAAAHCFNKLKKDQVQKTDISSSVDTILRDEVPAVTYRILGYLLLGLVRIFSKKAEFLFHDCHDVLDKLRDFMGCRGENESVEAMGRSYYSITLPERFELDAFDLDILEDEDFSQDNNVRPCEEITLPDISRGGIECSNDKYYHDEDIPYFGAYSSAHTPVRDVCSPSFMNIDLEVTSLCDLSNLNSSLEKLYGSGSSLEDCLEPMMLGDAAEELNFDMPSSEGHENDGAQIKHPDAETSGREPAELVTLSDKEQSREKLRGIEFSSEVLLESMIFSKIGKETSLVMPSIEGCQTERKINHDSTRINLVEPEELDGSFDKEQNMEPEQMRILEMTSFANQIKEKHRWPINVDETLESNFPGGSGAASPEFIGVKTPATKERATVLKKRKCLCDETVLIPDKVFRRWMDDPSHLVSKRKNAPLTWKAHKISNLPQSFFEPLIPCSVDFRSPFGKNALMTTKPAEIPQLFSESPVMHRSCEETPIAPSTPISNSTSLRLHEVEGVSRPDISEPVSSFGSMESQPTPCRNMGVNLMDEEINSSMGENPDKYECSGRTRRVATYLYNNFQNQREQKGDGIVNLSQVLERKTKSKSARMFYEILALKSGDYINVQQENPYGDILVLETSKLEQIVRADGVSLGP